MKALDRGIMTFEVQGQRRICGCNQHLALNHDVTEINAMIDPVPLNGIFGLLRQERAGRRVRCRTSWQWAVLVFESTSTHSPKHVLWQCKWMGN
ncbi:hypothetical protein ABIA06_002990 [Bradyrhizobium yuanmingense]|uniref:hypothetical protein n=1 Tax=Bradyrhizobium yuanmingense TaxID=108015 RepID=UPI003518D7FA